MMKPTYRVPLMSEIEAIPSNGYNVVSTFSGCGGSSLGYKLAGYSVRWANEFVPSAQDTYRLNHLGTVLDTRDIRLITGAELLEACGLQVGDIDIFDGSPPCASFSTAGKREAGWGREEAYSGTRQRTDDLFYEYARLIRDTQPKTFVAENVSGLVKGVAKGYFKIILALLKSCGYRVEAQLLDAQWLGVPQMRQRIIFIGVRNDLPAQPIFPKPLPYRYTVQEVLPQVRSLRLGGSPNNWKDANRPAGTVVQSDGARQSTTAYLSSYMVEDVHGIRRKFTIAELKRICGFPDDFLLTGTFAQQWERIGRAVPPVMMSHVAAMIRDRILPLCNNLTR